MVCPRSLACRAPERAWCGTKWRTIVPLGVVLWCLRSTSGRDRSTGGASVPRGCGSFHSGRERSTQGVNVPHRGGGEGGGGGHHGDGGDAGRRCMGSWS